MKVRIQKSGDINILDIHAAIVKFNKKDYIKVKKKLKNMDFTQKL